MSVNSEELEQIIASEINDSQVNVTGGDGKYQVSVVADLFEGLNAVKRQQTVYRILNPHIASGAIHAVNMHLLTHTEHAESQ